jgi:hypothetical protein
MAHFAKIKDDKVIEVIVAEQEHINTLDGEWVQTSYNTFGGEHKLGETPLRKNFAGIGYTYDRVKDVFIPPNPYTSWTINETTCLWEAPVAYPDDGKEYKWNEKITNWEEVT